MDLDIYIPLIYMLDSSLSIPLIYAIEIGASTGIYDFFLFAKAGAYR